MKSVMFHFLGILCVVFESNIQHLCREIPGSHGGENDDDCLLDC